ncbi:DsbA family protein [Candidatus Woesearchaeota archaeon]|nr:DsbA family protein [Candidatus Woesearchaeota archaeon]
MAELFFSHFASQTIGGGYNMEEHHEEHKKHREHKKKETVTFTKIGLWQGVSGVLGILLVLSLFTGGFGLKDSPSKVAGIVPSGVAPSAPSAPSAGITDMKALADDDAFLGKKDAPVTIVEWSDYECPFCERFHSQTLDQIKSQYIDTGKVKFVYRDFPLGFHDPLATQEAMAAECAREQGDDKTYFDFHDLIFKTTKSNGNGLQVSQLYDMADTLGLNKAKLIECIDSGKYKAEIQKDIQDGAAAGIQGTPGFIINGKLVSGAQPFSVFKQVIDAELAG